MFHELDCCGLGVGWSLKIRDSLSFVGEGVEAEFVID